MRFLGGDKWEKKETLLSHRQQAQPWDNHDYTATHSKTKQQTDKHHFEIIHMRKYGLRHCTMTLLVTPEGR